MSVAAGHGLERGELRLRVRGAEKRFGRQRALAGLDLELATGEWLGLVGPNGAGKTTLMLALAGLLELDGGTIRFFAPDGATLSATAARDTLGLVPQEIALYPALTARENLEAFARLHGVSRRGIPERVAWALEWTGLAQRADGAVAGFSGGMKRRLNIACGVLHGPAVLLLDEPTVGVDPQARRRIHEMLDELRRGGTALVQSSHHLDELESRCDRLVVVDRGRVVAAGRMEELAARLPRRRRLVVTLDRRLAPGALGTDFAVHGDRLEVDLGEVTAGAAAVLRRLEEAGVGVVDLHLERAGLEEVFTRLTGQELRE